MIASSCGYCDRTLKLLLRTISGILLLRDGPDALPSSWFLFGASMAAVVGIGIAQTNFFAVESPPDYFVLVGLLAIHVSAYWLVLRVAGKPERFLQAITASAACGALVNIVAVLLYLVLAGIEAHRAPGTLVLLLILHAWLLLVDGHIIARSTDLNLTIGIVVAVGITILQTVFDSAF